MSDDAPSCDMSSLSVFLPKYGHNCQDHMPKFKSVCLSYYMAQGSPIYTLPQKKSNFTKVSFWGRVYVFCKQEQRALGIV